MTCRLASSDTKVKSKVGDLCGGTLEGSLFNSYYIVV